jgi:hypothetical protein
MPARNDALSSPEKVWPKALFAFIMDPTNNIITGIEYCITFFIYSFY